MRKMGGQIGNNTLSVTHFSDFKLLFKSLKYFSLIVQDHFSFIVFLCLVFGQSLAFYNFFFFCGILLVKS